MVARHRHAVGRGEHPLESLAPVAGGEIDARVPELRGRKRQHDVGLGAALAREFQAKDVGAAGGGTVHGQWRDCGEGFAHRLAHRLLEGGRKPARLPSRRVDHVAGEDQHRRNGEERVHVHAGRGQARLQPSRLQARGAEIPEALAREQPRLAVAHAGLPGIAENQRRFPEGGLPPVARGLRRLAALVAAAGLAHGGGDPARARKVVHEDRHRRRIDAGVGRVRHGAALARRFEGPFVETESGHEVLAAPRPFRFAQREILVGAREHPQGFRVVPALGGQRGEDPVRALEIAAAHQRQGVQLPQARVLRPALERRLRGVAGEQRLAAVELALRTRARLLGGVFRGVARAGRLMLHGGNPIDARAPMIVRLSKWRSLAYPLRHPCRAGQPTPGRSRAGFLVPPAGLETKPGGASVPVPFLPSSPSSRGAHP